MSSLSRPPKAACAALFTLAFSAAAPAAAGSTGQEWGLRATVDHLDGETDGVAGFAGLTLVRSLGEHFYFGAGVYSAAFGESGGLYIGGFEAGYRQALGRHWAAELGLLVGGGGGATVVDGDGVLIRPRLALIRRFQDFNVLIGAAHYDLSGSNISDYALEIGLEVALAQGGASDGESVPSPALPGTTLYAKQYLVRGSRLRNSTAPLDDFQLLGADVRLGRLADSDVFIQAAGVVSGAAEGYAEWFVGLRQHWQLGPFVPSLEGGLGTGGGGAVNSGGGAIAMAGVGIDVPIGDYAAVGLKLGYARSLNGDFEALAPSLSVSGRLAPKRGTLWISPTVLRLYENEDLRKQGQRGEDIDAFGLAMDVYVAPRVYLGAKAYTAFTGHAGGFQIGLVGVGGDLMSFSKSRVFLEGGLGAAGGAGIETAGGALAYGRLGAGTLLGEDFEVFANVSRIRAISPGMDSYALEGGVRQRF